MSPPTVDAVVVGSGAAGGWAALKLTRAGLKVVVLEAGRALVPERDFKDHTPPEDFPLRGARLPRQAFDEQPVQIRNYALTEQTRHFFVNDRDHPYVTPEGRPFDWIRSKQVGGRTLVWGRMALRMSDGDFHAASRDGYGIDWPLRYAELAPYYAEVESFIGVSGQKAGVPSLPDGEFLPALKLSCGEQLLRTAVKRQFGRTLVMGPTAVLTQEHQGRAQCHYCGPCERGCITASYFSSPSSTLAAAAQTGRLTLIPNAMVREVLEGDDGRATGVAYVDASSGEERELKARVIVLCASTLESTRILLCSRSRRWPTGLGNASGVLGHYLMDHVAPFLGVRRLPALSGTRDARGHRPSAFYIPRFQNLHERNPKFLRGYALQGASHDTGAFGHVYAQPAFGAALKASFRRNAAEWYVWMVGMGECLPRFENHCTLEPGRTDRWGIPILRIDMRFGDNERAMMKDMAETSAQMLDAAGAVGEPVSPEATPGAAVHEVGTARMGSDPKNSYLNRWNQSHEVRNLFILDGAAFPSSPCQNPTLTLMALAARASDHLVEELRAGNL